jgi:hypothetical protein
LATARSEVAAKANVLSRAERLFAQGLAAGAEVEQARVDLQQAKIGQDRAEQRLANAQRTFERESRVSSSGLLNAREIQSAEAEVRAARLEIERERIALPSLYYSHKREVVERKGLLVPVTPLTPAREGETPALRQVRFRTVGDITCTCPVESLAAEGMTLLMVTHEMSFARKVCDRVVFMHQGRVHETGAPDQVFSNPQTPELKQFLGMIQ